MPILHGHYILNQFYTKLNRPSTTNHKVWLLTSCYGIMVQTPAKTKHVAFLNISQSYVESECFQSQPTGSFRRLIHIKTCPDPVWGASLHAIDAYRFFFLFFLFSLFLSVVLLSGGFYSPWNFQRSFDFSDWCLFTFRWFLTYYSVSFSFKVVSLSSGMHLTSILPLYSIKTRQEAAECK